MYNHTHVIKNMRVGQKLHIPCTGSYPERVKKARAAIARVHQVAARHGLVFATRRVTYGLDVYCVADDDTRRHRIDDNITALFCESFDRVPRPNKPGANRGNYPHAALRKRSERAALRNE